MLKLILQLMIIFEMSQCFAEAICTVESDKLCAKIWDKSHKGTLEVFDGKIEKGINLFGHLKVDIYNFRNFIETLKYQDDELQEALKEQVLQLKDLLDHEKKSKKWDREIVNVNNKINDIKMDLFEKKFNEKYPHLNLDEYDKWKIEDQNLYSNFQNKFFDKIFVNTVTNTNEWKRVEASFALAKNLLLEVVRDLPKTNNYKNKLLEKISSVELTPYKLEYFGDSNSACRSTEVNAFYMPIVNKFTVCNGLLYSYQTMPMLVFTIAHEISHSIDSGNMTLDEITQSPIFKFVRVSHSCNEWDNLLSKKYFYKNLNNDEMNSLNQCFLNNYGHELNKIDNNALDKIFSDDKIKYVREINDYIAKLSDPYILKNGKKTINDSFLDPTDLIIYNDKYIKKFLSLSKIEVYSEQLKCVLEKKGLAPSDFSKKDFAQKDKIISEAMSRASQIDIINRRNTYNYYGIYSSNLDSYNMTFDTSEYMADWYATKVFRKYLDTLKPANRLEATVLGMSLFCNNAENEEYSDDITKIQKKYSSEPHGENKIRRYSIFNKEIAGFVGCQIDYKGMEGILCEP